MLTAIIRYSDLVWMRLDPDDPRRKDVEEIKKAGERAAALTHQLLAFSRQQVLQPKVVDLNSLVSHLEKMLRRLVSEDIELVTVLGAELGRIKVDQGQIEQVIMNLVINARDAMPRGGRLSIETQNVELGEGYARRHVEGRPGPHVMLAVSDTGCGMEAEVLSHIFEPFYTTKGSGKGTGLGLSTVYGIVKQSDGHIWVYSEPGTGTSFKIYFPRLGEGAEPHPVRCACASAPPGSETVLLVEDDELVRTMVSQMLQRTGYKVLEAGNGPEALQVCAVHGDTIHIVVTDVVMPQMNGQALAQQLISLRPELKVLFMSGYTEQVIVMSDVLQPSMAFLQKPFTPHALACKVRALLDHTS